MVHHRKSVYIMLLMREKNQLIFDIICMLNKQQSKVHTTIISNELTQPLSCDATALLSTVLYYYHDPSDKQCISIHLFYEAFVLDQGIYNTTISSNGHIPPTLLHQTVGTSCHTAGKCFLIV